MKKGFTLIELVLVIAIICILAAVGILAINSMINRARLRAADFAAHGDTLANQIKEVNQLPIHPAGLSGSVVSPEAAVEIPATFTPVSQITPTQVTETPVRVVTNTPAPTNTPTPVPSSGNTVTISSSNPYDLRASATVRGDGRGIYRVTIIAPAGVRLTGAEANNGGRYSSSVTNNGQNVVITYQNHSWSNPATSLNIDGITWSGDMSVELTCIIEYV